MVADTDNQKTPLVVQIEMQPVDADLVRHHLERDNVVDVKQLAQQYNPAAVLRPKLSGPSADTATSLHIAAKHGAEKCLKVLLSGRPSTEDLEAPDSDGKTALLTAVANARPKALQQLLLAGANVNARGDNHRGALHLLVLQLSSKSKEEEEQSRLLEVADLLLSATYVSKLDLEPHANLAGLTNATPLAVAAAKLQQGNVPPSLIQLCKKLVTAGASLSETVEQVLTQKGCLTTELLQGRRRSPQRPTAAHVVDVISMGRSSDEVREVLQGKPQEEVREAVNSSLGSHSLLFHAVNTTNTPLVEVLLEHGARPWVMDVTGELSLHRAAAKGHLIIFTKLLEKMKGRDKTLDLREHSTSLVRKLMENSRSKVAPQDGGHLACLRRLLQEDIQLNLNQKDQEQTALHVAAAFNNQEAVSEVLQAGAFLGARQTVLGKDYDTVLDSVLPDTLERAMDGCITHHCEDGNNKTENVVSEEYTLHLDYRFLVPPQQEDTKSEPEPVNEMETLMEVCRSKRHRHAIKHPLVQTLLYAKWRKALPLYLANVGLYLFFVVVLTVFVYFLKDLRLLQARLSRLRGNGTNDTSLEASVEGLQASVEGQQASVYGLMVLLLLAWLYMLVRELFQIRFSREFYLKSIENYLEWFLLVVVVVLCFVRLGVDSTRHLAAWAMIVAWYEFVLVLGRAPDLALYITMLRHVSWNFVKLIFLFSALILAFTISFNIILQPSGDDENEDFRNFWTTLPKAIVMSTGEFEYSDLSGRFPKTMLMTSAVLVFLVFLFLIFLVLMNVMNGLAVTDTQQVVDDAKLYSLTSRLELVYLVETFFLRCPFVRSFMGNVQLLSGPGNAPSLKVRMNDHKKNQRLLSGRDHNTRSKLDNDSTECLRLHRLQHLQEEESKQRDESTAQLEAAVQDLAAHHPQLLRSLAAALRPGQ